MKERCAVFILAAILAAGAVAEAATPESFDFVYETSHCGKKFVTVTLASGAYATFRKSDIQAVVSRGSIHSRKTILVMRRTLYVRDAASDEMGFPSVEFPILAEQQKAVVQCLD
ncbi:MAG: hypothetical protein OXC28_05000 [Defluviicoccus sp.]|nr:hypothetical protein [Defluviicoccus sp.]